MIKIKEGAKIPLNLHHLPNQSYPYHQKLLKCQNNHLYVDYRGINGAGAGKSRKILFTKYPLHKVIVSSSRLMCAKNGDFKSDISPAIDFAWFVWKKGYTGDAILKWV